MPAFEDNDMSAKSGIQPLASATVVLSIIIMEVFHLPLCSSVVYSLPPTINPEQLLISSMIAGSNLNPHDCGIKTLDCWIKATLLQDRSLYIILI